jgi:hypothetical protein
MRTKLAASGRFGTRRLSVAGRGLSRRQSPLPGDLRRSRRGRVALLVGIAFADVEDVGEDADEVLDQRRVEMDPGGLLDEVRRLVD